MTQHPSYLYSIQWLEILHISPAVNTSFSNYVWQL